MHLTTQAEPSAEERTLRALRRSLDKALWARPRDFLHIAELKALIRLLEGKRDDPRT